MGAVFPCLPLGEPPRGPPPMARPPPPCVNTPLHRWEGGTAPNDWRRLHISNPGHFKAPPPHLAAHRGLPLVYGVPVKAPPPHLPALPQLPLGRGVPPVKAPPPHVLAVPEGTLPPNQAFAVVRGG